MTDSDTPAAFNLSSSGIQGDTAKKHIRGSSLLLLGRMVSLGLNFFVQVLTVRYLSKNDFGAFAYALSIVAMGTTLTLLGMDKVVTRFVPIYQERHDYRRMFGTIAIALGSIFGIGMTVILVVLALRGVLANRLVTDPLSVSLLLIVIALSPLHALDGVFQGMLAVFAAPRAIFVRRHLLGPGLKLATVVFIIVADAGVYALAAGYVVAGFLGVGAYVTVLWKVLREQGLWDQFSIRTLVMPIREVFAFSVPLIATDLGLVVRTSMVVLLLEYYRGPAGVADLRAVLPLAGLNLVVFQSFKYLFMPAASRLFAHDDKTGMNDLYWQTAIWIAVMSFPVFAVTFSLAQPLVSLMFGERYAGAWILLAVLSFGDYFNAALGFNVLVLKVYAKIRYIVVVDIVCTLIALGLYVLLIPGYGALGAAIGMSAAVILLNVLNQAGLLFGTKIQLFEWRYATVYVSIIAAGAGLLAIQAVMKPPLVLSIGLVMVMSLLLIRFNRRTLNLSGMFPEFRRIRLLRPLLGM